MEELLSRHAKERKELQGKITSKKKNATKKTRKGVNDECDRLEYEMQNRQKAEVEALAPSGEQENQLAEELEALTVNETNFDSRHGNNGVDGATDVSHDDGALNAISTTGGNAQPGKKPNRQKARQARKAAEVQAQMEQAEREAANMPDKRDIELNAMKRQLDTRGLIETTIRPDGHCLYSACAHTIPATQDKDYKAVRQTTSEYIAANPDDFAPFMEEPLTSYTQKIRDTAEWGGHLELQAIANAYSIAINVLHANGQVDRIVTDKGPSSEIWLAYYQHSFGLGEHYNALRKAVAV